MIVVYIIIGGAIWSLFEKGLIKISPKLGWRIFVGVFNDMLCRCICFCMSNRHFFCMAKNCLLDNFYCRYDTQVVLLSWQNYTT